MNREQAVTQPNNRCAKTEPAAAHRRDILYVDAQALTRNCIAREFARRLPEFNILEHALVQELAASGDPRLHTAAVAILYVHAERFGQHADGEPETSGVAMDLDMLEQMVPDVPRVLLSEVEVPEHIVEAFHRRIRGYVPTTLPIDQVAEAIRFVAAGGTFVPQSILSLHSRPSCNAGGSWVSPHLEAAIGRFSPRQTQVLRMLWKGCSNKLIAYELRMCESTVKVHIRHIMKKLNVSNRTQIVLKTRPQLLDDNRALSLVDVAGQDTGALDRSRSGGLMPNHVSGVLLGRLESSNIRKVS